MESNKAAPRIKITKGGPYIVTGNVPLREMKIVHTPEGNVWEEVRTYPLQETHALCRCGKSKNKPFCDGTHEHIHFSGTETAARSNYEDRAEWQDGPGVDLMDDNRCAFARFCHRRGGSVWELVDESGDPKAREEAIRAASDCPAGRLTAVRKDGGRIEPEFDHPEIVIVQDPEKGVSGGLFVKGGIVLESADGTEYELRNRYTLCRCGQSRRKPFCDATHVPIGFDDKE